MNANELMIDNWINWKDEPIQVTMIGQYGIQSKTEERIINAKFSTTDLKPIPLTPKILEKSGFENDNNIGWNIFNVHLNKRISLPFDKDNEARIVMPFQNGVMTIAKSIIYLHQLQNLIFALTGEELQINL